MAPCINTYWKCSITYALFMQEACDICEQVVPKIRDFLAKNTTQVSYVELLIVYVYSFMPVGT